MVANWKKIPDTNTEQYDWKLVPNAKAALAKDGFSECFVKYTYKNKPGANANDNINARIKLNQSFFNINKKGY